jgi:N-acyl-D-amino-acid deacylase
MAFDLIIRHGRVADGTGNPWFPADVGIEAGRITAVGQLTTGPAEREIDATGRLVSPGFIDIHSHSDFILPLPREEQVSVLAPFIRQGITTLVTGNCGYSPAPVNDATLAQLQSYTMFLKGAELAWTWRSFDDYLSFLEAQGVSMNVVPLVAHGAVRIHELGFDSRAPTPDEFGRMQKLVAQSVEAGAFGLSSGLLYAPGIFAPPEEIEELASALRPYNAIYTSHIRGSSETLIPATKEVIRVGEINGITCQHSHIEAFGREHWPKLDRVLGLHEAAKERGVNTGFDVIPYTSANTTLLAIMPPWALAGGVDALLERLRDPATRQRISRSIDEDVPGWPCWTPGGWPHNLVEATGWDNIRVIWVESEANKQLEGRSIADLAREQGTESFDALADLLLAENGHGMGLYIGVSGDLDQDDGLEKLVRHPWAAIETDAILTGKGVPHPAGYGAFPRVLGHFARDRKLFPMEEAVRKMTSLPAERFGLKRRGLLREGCCADVTIFDPTTVADNTTYAEPTRPPSGIEYVLINGQVVVDHGRLDDGALAGQVIRRGASNA